MIYTTDARTRKRLASELSERVKRRPSCSHEEYGLKIRSRSGIAISVPPTYDGTRSEWGMLSDGGYTLHAHGCSYRRLMQAGVSAARHLRDEVWSVRDGL